MSSGSLVDRLSHTLVRADNHELAAQARQADQPRRIPSGRKGAETNDSLEFQARQQKRPVRACHLTLKIGAGDKLSRKSRIEHSIPPKRRTADAAAGNAAARGTSARHSDLCDSGQPLSATQ